VSVSSKTWLTAKPLAPQRVAGAKAPRKAKQQGFKGFFDFAFLYCSWRLGGKNGSWLKVFLRVPG
jgi:hypothetical protein